MNLRDGRYIPFSHEVKTKPNPTSNITVFYDTVFPSFFPDFLDPSQLSLPQFCARGAASFFKKLGLNKEE